MKLIAHRGNINGVNSKENSPEYIISTINLGYDVEIDLWIIDNKIYLGHDEPQYQTSLDLLSKYNDNLWIHAKNIEALTFLYNNSHTFKQFFWHQTDDVALTYNNYLWTYPGKLLSERSIAVKPEITSYTNDELKKCYGICSDFIINYGSL